MISIKRKYYAGIGSRETPTDVLEQMENIASYLCYVQNYILRSGGASGADAAFEAGVTNIDKKEIYLPWRNFNGNSSPFYYVTDDAWVLAERFHPGWHVLSQGAKRLQARNVYQVLGLNLKTPVRFIICWTNGRTSGGTGQAMRIAVSYNIPIFNLFHKMQFEYLQEKMSEDKDFV